MSGEEPWHEKDEFWESYPFSDKMIEHAGEEVDQLIELAGLEEGMELLDLCCGVGRHSIEFAKRGFDVTGVDRTERYLERGRDRAQEEGLDIDFVQDDMREFRREGEFDAAVNLFTSFGYFEEEQENMKVLENVCTSLRSGGKFIIDVMGKEIIARIYKERDWHKLENGYQLEERSVEKDWSWLNNRRIRIENGEVKEHNFSHWLYSAKELKDMLNEAGFSDTKAYGGYDGKKYCIEADRLVVVGER